MAPLRQPLPREAELHGGPSRPPERTSAARTTDAQRHNFVRCVESLQGVMIMTQDSERKAREAQTAKAKQKEGYGAVPNVTEEDDKDEVGELKNAVHEYEEKKGDWSKTGG